ncbi:MAG: hypothetical protein ACFFD3_17420 [Candidatus Thorarchaeota archaeon]
MKQYDTGMSTAMTSAVVIAIVLISGLVAVTVFFPGGLIPTTTPTTTTPTTPTTTTPNGGFGIRAADYLNSRREDVVFYCILNSTIVNEDLSAFYAQSHPGAFVDVVKLWRTETGGDIEVGFSPYDANIVGTGSITIAEWETLSGMFVNGAIAEMPDASNPPSSFPSTWPIELYMGIYFSDNTFFQVGYTASDGMVNLVNGTWTGGFTEWGWPEHSGYDSTDHWLSANGLLDAPMGELYSLITENAPYPGS